MGIAKKHLLRAFDDESSPGAVIVVTSQKVKRTALITWAINEFAGDIDPDDQLCALYVCAQPDVLARTRAALRKLRNDAANDFVISSRATQLPKLRALNYAKLRTVHYLADRFAPDSLDLLLLDERQTGEMQQLADFVARVQPLVTILITGRPLPDDHPWVQLGEPLVLHGSVQELVPPASAKTSDE